MSEPTATLIAEARELCAKATPPPWGYSEMSPLHEGLYRWAEICTDDDSVVIAETDQEGNIRVHPGLNDDSPQFEADGKFMSRSRTLLPALADALSSAQERIQSLESSLTERTLDCEQALRVGVSHMERANALESRLTKAREPLLELEQSCPCGARPESLKTHPHVTGCLVAAALAILNDPAVASPATEEQP